MAMALPIAAAGLSMAGGLMEAKGQADGLKASAKADEENARLEALSGEIDVAEIHRDARAAAGEAIAAQAANGAGIGTGSARDLLEQSAIDAEYDVLARRYNASSQAQQLYAQAKSKRKAARGVMFAGVLRAGATALTAASGIAGDAKVAKAQDAYSAARSPSGSLQLPAPRGI